MNLYKKGSNLDKLYTLSFYRRKGDWTLADKKKLEDQKKAEEMEKLKDQDLDQDQKEAEEMEKLKDQDLDQGQKKAEEMEKLKDQDLDQDQKEAEEMEKLKDQDQDQKNEVDSEMNQPDSPGGCEADEDGSGPTSAAPPASGDLPSVSEYGDSDSSSGSEKDAEDDEFSAESLILQFFKDGFNLDEDSSASSTTKNGDETEMASSLAFVDNADVPMESMEVDCSHLLGESPLEATQQLMVAMENAPHSTKAELEEFTVDTEDDVAEFEAHYQSYLSIPYQPVYLKNYRFHWQMTHHQMEMQRMQQHQQLEWERLFQVQQYHIQHLADQSARHNYMINQVIVQQQHQEIMGAVFNQQAFALEAAHANLDDGIANNGIVNPDHIALRPDSPDVNHDLVAGRPDLAPVPVLTMDPITDSDEEITHPYGHPQSLLSAPFYPGTYSDTESSQDESWEPNSPISRDLISSYVDYEFEASPPPAPITTSYTDYAELAQFSSNVGYLYNPRLSNNQQRLLQASRPLVSLYAVQRQHLYVRILRERARRPAQGIRRPGTLDPRLARSRGAATGARRPHIQDYNPINTTIVIVLLYVFFVLFIRVLQIFWL